MRKVKLAVLAFVLMLLMSGCHLKEKIGESITEGLIEQAAGDGTDIEFDDDGEDVSIKTEDGEVTMNEDGDDISIQTEEGEFKLNEDDESFSYEGEDGSVVLSGGVYEWPEDLAAAYLPKMDAGKVTYLLNTPTACMLTVSEVTLDDFTAYKDVITNEGYVNDSMTSSTEDMELYSGSKEDGSQATIFYTPSQSAMSISVDVSAIVQE